MATIVETVTVLFSPNTATITVKRIVITVSEIESDEQVFYQVCGDRPQQTNRI